jgi:hypothetical protein
VERNDGGAMNLCTVTLEETPDTHIAEYLRNALSEFNRDHAGQDHHKDLLRVTQMVYFTISGF